MAKITRFKFLGSERLGNGIVEDEKEVSRGTIAMFNADGKVDEINDVAGCVFAGIIKASAGSGEPCEFDYGPPFFYAEATAARANTGKPVYASGAGALALTSENSVFVGTVVDVEPSIGWWIDPMKF